MSIIQYLLHVIQYQNFQIRWLLNFICKYVPLKQWAHDDAHSPKYQKFATDRLPLIKVFHKQDWQFLLGYYQWRYGKPTKPVQRRNGRTIPDDTICPRCNAPHHYLSSTFVGDETYAKVAGLKCYVWFVIDAATRSILGYQVSDNRSVGPCILAMRMALRGLKKLPEAFTFVADGFSAYPLAAMQFYNEYGEDFKFDITQVIGLTNEDEVSAEFRPFKQLVERLNRTFKESYRVRCGYGTYDGANYNVAPWVAYYNFLRPHKANNYKVLNDVEMIRNAQNMPGKWQALIYLGQQTILRLQGAEGALCS